MADSSSEVSNDMVYDLSSGATIIPNEKDNAHARQTTITLELFMFQCSVELSDN